MRQAEIVSECLQARYPGLRCEIVGMSTAGDRAAGRRAERLSGKAQFTQELEQSLLDGTTDLAVHSMKDVAAAMPPGLEIGAMLQREDPRDILACRPPSTLTALPAGARIGTGSLRRRCQLLALRPDLEVVELTGNVNTRLGHLDRGLLDGAILAAAGVRRLGLESRIAEVLQPVAMIPAIGQGAIGVQIRADDSSLQRMLAALEDLETRRCVEAERAVNETLHGDCRLPIAAHAELRRGHIAIRGMVGKPDGSCIVTARAEGPAETAAQTGATLARRLLAQGAGPILEETRQQWETD